MPTNRTPVRRARRNAIHPEAIALYRLGRKLIAEGKQDSEEFKDIAKTLNWSDMLDRAPHMVSLFEDLSGDPPIYMQNRNSPTDPDFNG